LSDTIVGIRMPQGMLKALKQLSEKKHFIDISELIRGIARQHWQQEQGVKAELAKLREEIGSQIEEKSRGSVISEIKKLREEIKGAKDRE